jgi:hypothetical protein
MANDAEVIKVVTEIMDCYSAELGGYIIKAGL